MRNIYEAPEVDSVYLDEFCPLCLSITGDDYGDGGEVVEYE